MEIIRKSLSKTILERAKNKICSYLRNCGARDIDLVRANMDAIEGLYAVNLIEGCLNAVAVYMSATEENPAVILINDIFVKYDENGILVLDDFYKDFIEKCLIHELLHAATCHISRKFKVVPMYEGMTEFLATKICGRDAKSVSGYRDWEHLVSILQVTFGENIINEKYFYNTDDLDKRVDELVSNQPVYDRLNYCMYVAWSIMRNDDITKELYDQACGSVFRMVCYAIIIPKLRNLSNYEQKKYMAAVLEAVKDTPKISDQIRSIIEEEINLCDLNYQVSKLCCEIKETHKVRCLNSIALKLNENNNEWQNLITVTDDGRIFLSKERYDVRLLPDNLEIESTTIKEKIFAKLFVQDKNWSEEDVKNEEQHVIKELNIQPDRDWSKYTLLYKLKVFSFIKSVTEKNGVIVLNSLSECRNKRMVFEIIQRPKVNDIFDFQYLKKLFKKYKIHNLGRKDETVIDRQFLEPIGDSYVSKIAKFAYLWFYATLGSISEDAEIPGETSALVEEMYNQISMLIIKSINEKSLIDTKKIYEEVSKMEYKDLKRVIYTLFENNTNLEIVDTFYKIHCDSKRIEVEFPKTVEEFLISDQGFTCGASSSEKCANERSNFGR